MGRLDGRRLLGVFAHPDDETHTIGGCVLRYTAEGARATILSFTRGEAGQIAKGLSVNHEELGTVREAELRAACRILGCDDVRVVGTPDGATQVTEEGIAAIVDLMDELKPDVVVTMEPHGVTRHPDHIAVHDMTVQAVERIREKGYPRKLYLAAWPEAAFHAFMKLLADRGISWLSPDDPLYPRPAADASIAAIVDAGELAERKLEALKAHATQADDLVSWTPEDILLEELRAEAFQRVIPPKDLAAPPETDLFAGIA